MTRGSAAIAAGTTALGIELGSTRIKACLIALEDQVSGGQLADGQTPGGLVRCGDVLATGAFDWANQFEDGQWTYSLDAVNEGVQECYARLVRDAEDRHGVGPTTFGALGISAMMHGYLPFDADGTLLVPFRTWRNTTTGVAAAELTEMFGYNIPVRWSVAHYYQAVLDGESHAHDVAHLTTLAGYVHERLTGRRVLGVGDASGMFPIDPVTCDYDKTMLDRLDVRLAAMGVRGPMRAKLPQVLVAGQDAGRLTTEGAAWLDPTGALHAGVPLCPPEGDAGTGMVATNSVNPRTGNISAGTSVFAMVVLERPLDAVHRELDLVTTPVGDLVAMVHCNNGASELATWVQVFRQFAAALSPAAAHLPDRSPSADDAFAAFLGAAFDGDADAGGVLAYNYLAGEPITALDAGRPLVVRTPDSQLTLANFARAQVYGVFATLALGMRVLAAQGVSVDVVYAHGGLFRTPGVAQQLMAAAIGAPVAVGATAGEGGAWGMALLASYLLAARNQPGMGLGDYLSRQVFAAAELKTAAPDPVDVAGFAAFLAQYQAGLAVEAAAVDHLAPVVGISGDVQAAIAASRARLESLHQELVRNELVVWTAGNVSERVAGADLFVIKPSGVPYDELTAEAMVVCDLDGNVVQGTRAPSSDTAAHAYVYRHLPEVGGVVHTHSTYATAWAARGEPVPCVLTMMADEFGGPIPVGPFALIGDDSIGRGIVQVLRESRSPAVLMQNHGPFTVGKDARAAVKAAVMCEEVARAVHISRQLGTPIAMGQADIDSLYDRYQNVYGRTPVQ